MLKTMEIQTLPNLSQKDKALTELLEYQSRLNQKINGPLAEDDAKVQRIKDEVLPLLKQLENLKREECIATVQLLQKVAKEEDSSLFEKQLREKEAVFDILNATLSQKSAEIDPEKTYLK